MSLYKYYLLHRPKRKSGQSGFSQTQQKPTAELRASEKAILVPVGS